MVLVHLLSPPNGPAFSNPLHHHHLCIVVVIIPPTTHHNSQRLMQPNVHSSGTQILMWVCSIDSGWPRSHPAQHSSAQHHWAFYDSGTLFPLLQRARKLGLLEFTDDCLLCLNQNWMGSYTYRTGCSIHMLMCVATICVDLLKEPEMKHGFALSVNSLPYAAIPEAHLVSKPNWS